MEQMRRYHFVNAIHMNMCHTAIGSATLLDDVLYDISIVQSARHGRETSIYSVSTIPKQSAVVAYTMA